MRLEIKDVFDYYYWEEEELLFAMVLSKKKERLLVGTKKGILEHFGMNDEVTASPPIERRKDKKQDSPFDVVWKDITQMAKETVLEGIGSATRREQERIRSRAEAFVPFVCDRSFELGHFLIRFERDEGREWETAIMSLSTALQGDKDVSECEEGRAKAFLKRKWKSYDPVCQFAALRIWMDYCAVRRIREAEAAALLPRRVSGYPEQVKRFTESSMKLVEAFFQSMEEEPPFTSRRIEIGAPLLRLPAEFGGIEDELRIWILEEMDLQCVMLWDTFYPLKLYYSQKMNEYGMRVGKCIECKEYFVAKSGKQKACGSKCAQIRKQHTSAQYRNEGAKGAMAKLRNNEYQFWYNRIRKAESISEFPPQRLEEMKAEFARFKREFQAKKKQLNQKELSQLDFNNWIAQQENIASGLMGNYEGRYVKKQG